MEILSELLKSLKVSGSVYFCDHLISPWQKDFQGTSAAAFHLVRDGLCWATIGDRVEQLFPGDLIFIGAGINHQLASQSPHQARGESSDSSLLLCGNCDFATDTLTPLKDIFPDTTIVRAQELQQHPWLKSTFEQLSAEYMAQSPGSEIIVDKLTEVVLIELIRINFGRREQNGFLKALQDKRISASLNLLHQSPEKAWTIELLASEIGMSRAAFAKRFTDLIGEPMFAYLSQLRMEKAKELLKNTQLPVDDIALKVGYDSERSFAKTFGKYLGNTPKQYRKNSANNDD